MLLDHLGQMRGDHAFRINDSHPHELCFGCARFVNPDRFQPEGRFARAFAGKVNFLPRRVNHHHHHRVHFPTGGLHPLQGNGVGIGGKLRIVLDPNQRQDKPEVFYKQRAEAFNLTRQRRIDRGNHRHETRAEIQPDIINAQHIRQLVFSTLNRCRVTRGGEFLGLVPLYKGLLHDIAKARHPGREREKDHQRKAGQPTDTKCQPRRDIQSLGEIAELPQDGFIRRTQCSALGHQQTSGKRHDQRRDLSDQTVTDR